MLSAEQHRTLISANGTAAITPAGVEALRDAADVEGHEPEGEEPQEAALISTTYFHDTDGVRALGKVIDALETMGCTVSVSLYRLEPQCAALGLNVYARQPAGGRRA